MEPGKQERGAAYFDQWYADMATSPARDAIVARTLGLPPQLQSASTLTWALQACSGRDWREVFPVMASYPLSPFDYAAEDAYLASRAGAG